ncbi:MAG: class I SAM-dependent methyltransferase [Anaerolineaceae bacterium]|nr:class I SAM-dependent methyltransferase [Anaerolineaceae bacterium]
MPNIHFDWLARWYDKLIGPPENRDLHDILELPIPGGLLEVGGGTGRAALPLCPEVGRLVICDLSLPMLRQAHVKGCLLTTQGRVEHLPYPDGSFERILAVDAYHHFPDQPGALREMIRVLAPGGMLVIEEPDIRTFGVKLIALMETLLLMDSHFRAPAIIAAALTDAGLHARIQTSGHTAWVVAMKPSKYK